MNVGFHNLKDKKNLIVTMDIYFYKPEHNCMYYYLKVILSNEVRCYTHTNKNEMPHKVSIKLKECHKRDWEKIKQKY